MARDRQPAARPTEVPGESSEADPTSLEATAQRISEMLSAFATIGTEPAGGITRLAYAEPERQAHHKAAAWLAELGFVVREDSAGNTIADDPTAADGTARIVLGSHLDSVPRGGSFDGTAGIVAAIEVVRWLRERGRRLVHPVRVVCFAGQEGARFGEGCLGSKAVAGALGPTAPSDLQDERGLTLERAMRDVGLNATGLAAAHWGRGEAAVFLELHVEQARTLEDQNVPLGIVDAIAGSARVMLTVRGRADHSGSTPMHDRGDALAAAAEIVLAVEAAGRHAATGGLRATVDNLVVEPNSMTTVPGLVRLSVEVRDIDTERLRTVATSIVTVAQEICGRRSIALETQAIVDASPVILPTWVRQVATSACQEVGLEYRVVTSSAGHDAQIMNSLAPAGLVLVPSRRGLGHVPEEWTSTVDIARGVGLLVEWIERLDQQLARWETISN